MESANPLRLIDALLKHNAPLVIFGGHAVISHGSVRATEDTAIVISRTPETEQALFAALTEVNAQ